MKLILRKRNDTIQILYAYELHGETLLATVYANPNKQGKLALYNANFNPHIEASLTTLFNQKDEEIIEL